MPSRSSMSWSGATLNLIPWIGGKGQMTSELLPLIPYAEKYVEPYGGGANVLLNRNRSPIEVYNDLNEDVVSLFRVMRNPTLFHRFITLLRWTPYSALEFGMSIDGLKGEPRDQVERAWMLYMRQRQGRSGFLSRNKGEWKRSTLPTSPDPIEGWWNAIAGLAEVHDRLKGVYVDHRPALDCIRYWDSPTTVFYLDPPYVTDTRSSAQLYKYEMHDQDHAAMVERLLQIEGMAVLSGYHSEIYKPLLDAGWEHHTFTVSLAAPAHENREVVNKTREESVWRNPKAVSRSLMRSLF
jgi:DNA adenine methylase